MTAPEAVIERVRALLREQFGGEVREIVPLVGGEFSRAFAFVAADRPYVIRLNPHPHAPEAFAHDDYAWRHFAAPNLPIPRIVALGRAADGFYAIAERVPGRRVEEFSREGRRALVPALLDMLDAIAGADVSGSRGYGYWDADCNGESASWRGHLAAVIDNRAEGFYADWHGLFRTSFLEREVYEAVHRRMLRLLDRCPEERALIHGDLHFDNLLADGRRITGVIDWANASYGDPVCDIAWMGRWNTAGGPLIDPALLRARYGSLPEYDARFAACEYFLALDDLRFYARTDRRADYTAMRDHLLAVLADDVG